MTPGLRNIARGATAAAGAIVAMGAAAFAAAKKLSDYGAEIFDMAAATGVAVEDIQSLGYAFEQTGGSMASMSGAIRGLNTFMRTAATGSAEYMNVLNQLGLSYDELRAMTPTDAFLSITDALGDLDSAMETNIAATTIFGGRYAQQIVGALEQADGSLRNLTESFDESGRALSGEQITALKKYSDAMTDLDYDMKNLIAEAIVPMLPQLKEMTDQFTELAREILPELIPKMESAINAMAEGLPVVVDLLVTAAQGWERINDIVQQNARSEDTLANIQDDLNTRVRAGIMTTEEAMAEWDSYGDLIVSVYGMQLREVNRALEDQFRLSEAYSQTSESLQGMGSVAMGQAGALASIALAYQNFISPPIQPEEMPDEVISSAGTAATKMELTLKQILTNFKEIAKVALSEKDTMEKTNTLEEQRRDMAIERKIAEAEADAARQAAIDNAKQAMAAFGTDMVMAAAQGEEARNRFWDNFAQRMLQTVTMNAFQQLLGLATGGIGGFFGGLFGFKGGGTVPGGQKYQAAGGMTVPGNTNVHGDKVPVVLTEPGEGFFKSRSQMNDMMKGSGGNNYYITYSPSSLISTASNAEISQAVPVIKRIMQKGNL